MNADQLLANYERLADSSDAVPRLRRFILDLAVRGKLVEQNLNDEPASELVNRVVNAKAQLIKEGKMRLGKGKLSSPVWDDGTAPPGWVTVQAGEIFSTKSGNSKLIKGKLHNKPDEGLIPGFSAAGQDVWLDFWEYDGTAAILSAVGARCGKAFFAEGRWSAIANTHIVWLLEDVTVSAFAMLVLNNEDFWVRSGGAQPFVKVKKTLEKSFLLPPLAEQHRIVAKVDELMALCDRLEAARSERESTRDRLAAASLARLNAPDPDPAVFQDYAAFALDNLVPLTTRPDQIKALRQTILSLAVRGKLAPQDPADEPASELLKRIQKWRLEAISHKRIRAPRKSLAPVQHEQTPYQQPNGWAWARLGQIIYVQSGDGLTAANMKDGEIPVFGGNGINGYHDQSNVDQQTIVIGRVGYYCGSVHVTPTKAWVTDNAFITHFSPDEIILRFLVLLLNGTNLKEDENATAQPVISGSKIYPIVVGLPPFAEQHRIVAKVDELMALCDRLEASLATGEDTRRRLLDALLHEALAPGEGIVSEQPESVAAHG
jgi:type I restriction enzyme S subunit